jgi:hypothetical protein
LLAALEKKIQNIVAITLPPDNDRQALFHGGDDEEEYE